MKYNIALVLALTLNAAANLMMKVGARRFGAAEATAQPGLPGMLVAVLSNWVLILGLACFATNVIFYAYALSSEHLKISVAYPIMVSGGFVIIAIAAWKWLGETMTPLQWAGVIIIMIGVWLVARDMNSASPA